MNANEHKIVGYRIRGEGPGRRWMHIDVIDFEDIREAVETGYRNNFAFVMVTPIVQYGHYRVTYHRDIPK